MKHFSHERWTSLLSPSFVNQIYIAYSGGIDSHVLLHLCAAKALSKDKIIAVYINHGLQSQAESWGLHCEHTCDGLGIQFITFEVNAKATPGQSPEEAARNARYSALKPLLGENDVLLVAQHAEDQLETVLLQLFRGSGLKGLSGMPESMPFGKGRLLRPLLAVSKAEIIDYAHSHNLKWIEDPSNRQSRYDRNLLRNEVLPLLNQRWPALAKTVARSASHCAQAQEIIAELSHDLLNCVINQENTLCLKQLNQYSVSRQALIIRTWFARLGIRMPSADVVQRILTEVAEAKEQAHPLLLSQGHEVRRYRDRLYCVKAGQQISDVPRIWPSDQPFFKLSDDLVYELVPSTTGVAVKRWQQAKVTVRLRSGGETIRLPGRGGSHCLKKLFQEVGIPPWQRAVIPLIYLDDKLAAIGEHWIAAPFYAGSPTPCFRLALSTLPIKGNDAETIVD